MSDSLETNINYGHKIVQSNRLIQQSNWVLDKVPLKIFKLFISSIDTSKPLQTTYRLSKTSLLRSINTDSSHNYNYIRNQIKQLMSQVIVLKQTDGSELFIHLIEALKWDNREEFFEFRFSMEIMPYLHALKSNFLAYEVADIIKMKSKYTLLLYELLLSVQRERPNKANNYVFSVDYLRSYFGTTTYKGANSSKKVVQHQRFQNFEKIVIKTAVDEINKTQGLPITVSYTKLKYGRTIESIKFSITKRTLG